MTFIRASPSLFPFILLISIYSPYFFGVCNVLIASPFLSFSCILIPYECRFVFL